MSPKIAHPVNNFVLGAANRGINLRHVFRFGANFVESFCVPPYVGHSIVLSKVTGDVMQFEQVEFADAATQGLHDEVQHEDVWACLPRDFRSHRPQVPMGSQH